MSLSSRDASASRRLRAAVASALGLSVAGVAHAAEVYYQPVASIATSHNSNVNLDNIALGRESLQGYFADLATRIGIATPTSDTTLLPRLVYDYYPSDHSFDRLEGFLNGNSRVSWQRDTLSVSGLFEHLDDLNAERPSAQYNEINPGIGNSPGSGGRIAAGTTRNYYYLLPTWTHSLSPRSGLGLGAEYQRISYSQQDTSSHIDFNYYLAKAFYTHALSVRSDYSVSVFGSQYKADSIDSKTDSAGVSFNTGYNWTQTLRSSLTLGVQQTRAEASVSRVVNDTTHPWSAALSTVYTGQTGTFRVDVGRILAPGSAGGLYTTDQVRGQYDHDFSERLHFTGALRYFRTRTLSSVLGDDTRDYATANVGLQWMITRTIFVAGNAAYIYQKYRVEPTSADSNIITLTFGYRGLERQRR